MENLYRYEVLDKSSETKYTSLIFQKLGKIGWLFLDIPSSIVNTIKTGDLLFIFPEDFKPKYFGIHLVLSTPSGKAMRIRYEQNTGKVFVLSSTSTAGESMYLNATYILES